MKKDKAIVQKAWRELGYGMPKDLDTKEKLESKVKELEKIKVNFEDSIAELKDRIVTLEEQIEKTSNYEGLLNNVLHQIKVERYKDLNKDKNIEVY